MKRILLALLLIISLSSNAQDDEYHPLIRDGFSWGVMSGGGDPFNLCWWDWGGGYFFNGDTLLDGNSYSLMRAYPVISLDNEVFFCPPYLIDMSTSYMVHLFLREDLEERKVYIKDQFYPEEILYDFSLDEGDTLFAYQGVMERIDSVRNVTLLNGESRKIFYLDSGLYYIESLGGLYGLQFPLITGIGFGTSPFCYREQGEVIWEWEGGYNNCMGVLSDDVEHLNKKISLFPNPATSSLLIQNLSLERLKGFEIYDQLGRKVYDGALIDGQNEINIFSLEVGQYIIAIETASGKNLRKKFVKVD